MAGGDDKPRRVDIGFSGGQVLSIRLARDAYESLHGALADDSSGRWHEVKSEDSDVTLDLAQIVYVRLDTEQHKVGF